MQQHSRQAVLGKAGLLVTSQNSLFLYLTDSVLGKLKEPGRTPQANPGSGWVQLPPPTWTKKKLVHWVRVPALGFINAGTVGKSWGLLEPQSPHLYNGMLLLTLFGFLPGLNENVEGVVVVTTGIKRAISLFIDVENVSVWMPKNKGPTGSSAAPHQPHVVGSVFWFLGDFQNSGFWGLVQQLSTLSKDAFAELENTFQG